MEHKVRVLTALLSVGLLALAFLPTVQTQWLDERTYADGSGEEEISIFDRFNEKDLKDWTLLMYLDVDNNLGIGYFLTYLLGIFLGLIPSPDLEMVILLDGCLSGLPQVLLQFLGISLPHWIIDIIIKLTSPFLPNDSFILELSSFSVNILDDAVIPRSSEVNMGDPQTLTNFVTWGMETYPSKYVGLIIMDHGGGWRGVCTDETSQDIITIPELGQAFRAIYEETGRKIDVVAFEACLMGNLEVAYEIGDYVDYIVGSEEVMLALASFLHTPFLLNLGSNPDMKPEDLAETIVKTFNPYSIIYPVLTNRQTFSSVSTDKLQDISTAVDSLARALLEKIEIYHENIRDARLNTKNYRQVPEKRTMFLYVDLYDLASNLYDEIDDDEIREACLRVMESVEEAVTAQKFMLWDSGSHGLSITFPVSHDWATMDVLMRYSTTSFAQDTHWDEFLTEMIKYYPVGEIGVEIALSIPYSTTPVTPIFGFIGGLIYGLIKGVLFWDLSATAIVREGFEGAHFVDELGWEILFLFGELVALPIDIINLFLGVIVKIPLVGLLIALMITIVTNLMLFLWLHAITLPIMIFLMVLGLIGGLFNDLSWIILPIIDIIGRIVHPIIDTPKALFHQIIDFDWDIFSPLEQRV